MFNIKDGVSELTTTTGTGDFVITARAGFVRFYDALASNPHLFVYEAHAVDGSGVRTGDFETGIGQFFNDAGTHKIRRVRKLSGSDYPTMTPLNFAAGSKVVSLVVAAAQAGGLRVGVDQDGDPVTLYVRADGNNSNSGLANSAGGAFLDFSYAVGEALRYYENATIVLGAGSFDSGYANDAPGRVSIVGAGVGSTTIQGIIAQAGQRIEISGCKIVSDGTGLSADGVGAAISAYDIEFGACDYTHAWAKNGGSIGLGAYSVSGGGGAHLRSDSFAHIVCEDVATVEANLTFSAGWAVCDGGLGLIQYDGGSIDLGAFSVTGKRYDIQAGSVCNTYGGGATFLPGSVAGTTASGGQYL